MSLPSLLVSSPLLCSVLGWWRSPEAVEARRRPQARRIVVVERPLIIARARFVFERWPSVPTPRASRTVDRRAGISDLFVREKRSTGIIIRFHAFEVGLLTLAGRRRRRRWRPLVCRGIIVGIFSTFLRNIVVSSITDFLTQSVSEDEGPGRTASSLNIVLRREAPKRNSYSESKRRSCRICNHDNHPLLT